MGTRYTDKGGTHRGRGAARTGSEVGAWVKGTLGARGGKRGQEGARGARGSDRDRARAGGRAEGGAGLRKRSVYQTRLGFDATEGAGYEL